ncbi:MAG: Wzz/FepE/Etk N-terminal domain-containing protein [Mariniphaga sp.]
MNDFFDNQRILEVIWKRKFHYVLIGVIAILLSAVFSGPAFIKPRYRSVAKIYPTNLEVFSEESETEQMLEIIHSKDIKLQMFDAFQLDQVYQIDKADPLYMTYMLAFYDKSVSASKTKFETVEIRVVDHDPLLASAMCDSIIHFYNGKVREMHKAKAHEMVEILKNRLESKHAELEQVGEELRSLRKEYGVLEYEIQVERVTEGYMSALVSDRTPSSHLNEIRDLYDNLADKGVEAVWLKSRHLFLLQSIAELTASYQTYLAEYNKIITYAHIVEHPMPADKKSYPVRWIIVAFSTLGAVFLAMLVFLILDYKKK